MTHLVCVMIKTINDKKNGLKMAKQIILKYPDPLLFKESEPVEIFDDSIQTLIEDMVDTMYSVAGVGLAAPQIGVQKQVLIFDTERKDMEDGLTPEEKVRRRNYTVLINPVILSTEGQCISEKEGCLSVPQFSVNVKRAKAIKLDALDRFGKPIHIDTDEYMAIVIQHEMDHLKGILLVNYVSSLKRNMYLKRLKKKNKLKKNKNLN